MSAANAPAGNTYSNALHPYAKSVPNGWKVEEKSIPSATPVPRGWTAVPQTRALKTKRIWRLVPGKKKPVTKKNLNKLANRLRSANFETGPWRWQNSPAAPNAEEGAAAAPAAVPAPPSSNMMVNEAPNANLNALTNRVGLMGVQNMEENLANWRAPTGGTRRKSTRRCRRTARKVHRKRTVRRHKKY